MDNRDRKVLIIDDDTRNIFALKAVLRSRGFEVLTAGSAREGLQQLQKSNGVDIVLLDMMMPEMDGYEALALIRKNHPDHIPVISVTAQAMVGDKEKCLEAGADGYISKPIDIDQLILLLNGYLG